MNMILMIWIMTMKYLLRIVFVTSWIGGYIVCVYGIVPLIMMNKCIIMCKLGPPPTTAFLQPNHVLSRTKLRTCSRNRSNSYGSDRLLKQMLKIKASDVSEKESLYQKQCQYLPDTSIQIQNLYQFLQEEECEGIDTIDDDNVDGNLDDSTSTGTQIGLSIPNNVRGLYTVGSYERDEFIVAIPVVTAFQIMQTTKIPKNEEGKPLTIETEVETESTSSIQSDVEKGIAYLLKRNEFDNNKKWERYFDSLPTPTNNCDKTIDFWIHNSNSIIKNRDETSFGKDSDNDNSIAINILNEFIPSMVNEAIERYTMIQQLSQKNNLTVDNVQFATWLVRSRMFTMIQTKSIGNEKAIDDFDTTTTTATTTDIPMSIQQIQRTMLIPYMDMINHVSSKRANAIIQVIEGMTDDESMFCIQAIKLIQHQQEICISYGTGDETTFELFSKYGFVPLDRIGYMIRYNPNDTIHINWDDNNDIINTSFFKNEIQTYNKNTGTNNIIKVIEQDDIQLLKSLPISSNQRTVIQLRIYIRRLYHHHLRRQQREQQLQQHQQQRNLEEDDATTTTTSSTITTTFLPNDKDDDDDDDDTSMNEIQINF